MNMTATQIATTRLPESKLSERQVASKSWEKVSSELCEEWTMLPRTKIWVSNILKNKVVCMYVGE